MYAVDFLRLEATRRLVRNGTAVNARSDAGWTLLMYASGDEETAWLLNEDGIPDALIRSGCECGAGPRFHALFDGATGAALAIEEASLWDDALARKPTHTYRFDASAPDWMRLFLTGALATRGFGPPSASGALDEHEGIFSAP